MREDRGYLFYASPVRVLGIDFGRRRIGLALSDASAVLARPWKAMPAAGSPAASARAVAAVARTEASDEDSAIGAIVVGLPRRLGGEDTDLTQPAREFAAALEASSGLPVTLQDERLTSREAESRLALRERDWRKRKAAIDAASAAIILQDFLDARAASRSAEPGPDPC
jgi:putative Holliday junction resolvase